MEANLEKSSNYYGGPTWKFWKRKRYIISVLAFFGFFNVFALRSILSIAIVDMTTLKNVTLENQTVVEKREFEWDSTLKGYVLSSFFYGYICTQILGGYLSVKFGGAKVYGAGIASTAFFTLLTPWVAKTSIYLLIALRTAEGIFEGVNYPSILMIWANWAPPLEISRLSTIAMSGTYVGTVVAMPISSILATNFGWESIFYVFGGLALIWCIIWTILVRDSPSKDPWISHQELVYITESINVAKSHRKLRVPWKSLLTSKAVWTLSLVLSCETWGFHTLMTFLPQMMKSALNFDLTKSGLISALPWIAMTFSIQVAGHLTDWILKKQYLTLTSVRKLTISIGFISQATFLFSAAMWISPGTTPIFIVLGATFGGMALSGIVVNPLDIAPKYASVIYGINNTFGTIPGIVSPILTGYIVSDLTNVDQWKIIFYISSGIYFLGAITSLIFITGVKQPWAETFLTGTNETELTLINGKKEEAEKTSNHKK